MKFEAPCREHLPMLWALWQEAFGDSDAFLESFFRSAFSVSRARCALIDGKLAGALYWFDCQCNGERVAYIYAVATASAYRGQGICRALMEHTHDALRKQGYIGAVLVPGDDGLFEMYRKMGYQTCGYVREIRCDAKEGNLSLVSIDRSEYATLRRQYLPVGGVVQERENLEFLEAQASFYRGDDFLLACQKNERHLRGIELLGNVEHLPQIVHALGCETGAFRTVGQTADRPFAMYCALQNKPMPTYFGLAFD